jgi:electron transport complex protein RnfD
VNFAQGNFMAKHILKPFISEPKLTVACPPYRHCSKTVAIIMGDFLLALIPAAVLASAQFGFAAARVMALAGAIAVLTEALCLKIMARDVSVDDYSALLTGLLFAFLLSPSAPWWLVTIGSSLSVLLGRIFFGGLGGSPLCAPLVAWAVCKISWPRAMDVDLSMLDSELVYPLGQLKYLGPEVVFHFNYIDLLLGKQLGGLGSAQIIGIVLGGLYLIMRKHIRPHIPLAFLAGISITAWITFLIDPTQNAGPIFHLLAGSAVYGAFFLATDYASSPVGRIPMILFGLIAGILVIIIRAYSVHPDGVPFAILLANLLTPLLDRIRPKPFGGQKIDLFHP